MCGMRLILFYSIKVGLLSIAERIIAQFNVIDYLRDMGFSELI